MLAWVGVGCITPIVVFATKFGLFNRSGYTVTTDALGNIIDVKPTAPNGWGMIACVLVGWTLIQIFKEIKNAHKGYSFVKQCLQGVVNTLIPFVIIIVAFFFLKNALDKVTFCLIVIGICRVIAVPLNPLPKWRYEKQGVEDYTDALEGLIKLIKDKLQGGGK
jgi:mannose/fructose/N-acetylgalactosamine-specific phosphotransferase system component IID